MGEHVRAPYIYGYIVVIVLVLARSAPSPPSGALHRSNRHVLRHQAAQKNLAIVVEEQAHRCSCRHVCIRQQAWEAVPRAHRWSAGGQHHCSAQDVSMPFRQRIILCLFLLQLLLQLQLLMLLTTRQRLGAGTVVT